MRLEVQALCGGVTEGRFLLDSLDSAGFLFSALSYAALLVYAVQRLLREPTAGRSGRRNLLAVGHPGDGTVGCLGRRQC